MRIYLDCSETYISALNTGIQRVARNLINESSHIWLPDGVECAAVAQRKSGPFRRIKRLDQPYSGPAFERLARSRIWRTTKRLFTTTQLTADGNTKASSQRVPRQWFTRHRSRLWKRLKRLELLSCPPAPFDEGDVLVLTEIFNTRNWEPIENLRRRGVHIGSIVHDIEPIHNPEFFPAGTSAAFTQWLARIARQNDFVMTVSQTVAEHLADYYQQQGIETHLTAGRIIPFRLGCELDGMKRDADRANEIRPSLRAEMQDRSRATLLSVGTIEPRKNHAFLLDVFDEVLARGGDLRCVVVGGVGWKCDAIVRRLHTHPELGKRLLVYHDLSDEELEFAYRHSDALVYPTHAEGFGLPLTEAIQRGLPIISNDLPVLRETSQEQGIFLPISQPEAWVESLLQFARGELSFPPKDQANGRPAISWRECTEHFLHSIYRLVAQPRDGMDCETDCETGPLKYKLPDNSLARRGGFAESSWQSRRAA